MWDPSDFLLTPPAANLCVHELTEQPGQPDQAITLNVCMRMEYCMQSLRTKQSVGKYRTAMHVLVREYVTEHRF